MWRLLAFGLPAAGWLWLAATAAHACDYGPGRIYFQSGGAALSKSGRRTLDEQLAYFSMVDRPGYANHVWLTAHTDSAGNADRNLLLSRRRAETVRAFLIRKGVPDSRIEIFNLGERAARTRRNDGTSAASDRFVEVEVVSPEEVASRSSNGHCG